MSWEFNVPGAFYVFVSHHTAGTRGTLRPFYWWTSITVHIPSVNEFTSDYKNVFSGTLIDFSTCRDVKIVKNFTDPQIGKCSLENVSRCGCRCYCGC